MSVDNSQNDGVNRHYTVRWQKPANTQASDTFAYQIQCTNQNNRNTTDWGACSTHGISARADTNVSFTVNHGSLASLFYYVRGAGGEARRVQRLGDQEYAIRQLAGAGAQASSLAALHAPWRGDGLRSA